MITTLTPLEPLRLSTPLSTMKTSRSCDLVYLREKHFKSYASITMMLVSYLRLISSHILSPPRWNRTMIYPIIYTSSGRSITTYWAIFNQLLRSKSLNPSSPSSSLTLSILTTLLLSNNFWRILRHWHWLAYIHRSRSRRLEATRQPRRMLHSQPTVHLWNQNIIRRKTTPTMPTIISSARWVILVTRMRNAVSDGFELSSNTRKSWRVKNPLLVPSLRLHKRLNLYQHLRLIRPTGNLPSWLQWWWVYRLWVTRGRWATCSPKNLCSSTSPLSLRLA